jgi:hypothetical protein
MVQPFFLRASESPKIDEWSLANEFKEKLNVEWIYLTIDNENHIVLTGFFSDTLQISNYAIPSDGALDIFIAKFTMDKELIWVKQVGGSNVDFSKFINTDSKNNIYIQGLFKGDAWFGDERFYSKTYDYFTAKFNNNGELLWVKTRKTMMETDRALKRKRVTDYEYTQLPK